MSIQIRSLLLGSAMLAATGFGASAADIFTPVSGVAPKADGPAAAASTLARVDTAALASGLKGTKSVGRALALNIAPGVSVPVVLDRQDPTGPGMQAFAAKSPGDPTSSSTIIIDGDTVYAVLQYKDATWEISHVADGVHRVTRIDQDKFPGDKVDSKERPNRAAADAVAASSAAVGVAGVAASGADAGAAVFEPPTANTLIRVAIMPSPKARTENSNWASIVQASLTDANTSFANSGVLITYYLIRPATAGQYYVLTNYDETGKTYDQMLADLRGSSGIQSFRNTVKADLVGFLRSANGAGAAYCGMANLPDPPSSATSSQAYSVSNISCAVSNHSYAHETGHNLGLRHDRYVENAFGKLQTKYNYGYSNVAKLRRSVMAYPQYCNSFGKNCTRVAYFSNPFRTVNGGVIGVNVGSTNPAYNARRLNETRGIIAAYR